MERNVKLVCCVVAILGLLCALTGFSAEGTRVKSVRFRRTCSYSRSPAYGLGIAAAAFLMFAQIIISAASRCTCCCSTGPHRSSSRWTLALVFFIISWFASIFATLVLLAAALLNDTFDYNQDNNNAYFNNNYCPIVRSGVFAGMTILGLVSLGLALTYYVILSSASKALPTSQVGIAMGQPQFPPRQGTQDPMFVHEDTYARRQVV